MRSKSRRVLGEGVAGKRAENGRDAPGDGRCRGAAAPAAATARRPSGSGVRRAAQRHANAESCGGGCVRSAAGSTRLVLHAQHQRAQRPVGAGGLVLHNRRDRPSQRRGGNAALGPRVGTRRRCTPHTRRARRARRCRKANRAAQLRAELRRPRSEASRGQRSSARAARAAPQPHARRGARLAHRRDTHQERQTRLMLSYDVRHRANAVVSEDSPLAASQSSSLPPLYHRLASPRWRR